MLKRLLVGLLLGLVIGGLAAAVLVKGLHMAVLDTTGGAIFAYVAAAIVGVVTGLVAGKPIWASGGQIEAGLKAVFGALLATGGMFALRQWAHTDVPLPADLGHGALGQLPAVALPLIAAVLGGFYELDNTGGGAKDEDTTKPSKVTSSKVSGGNGRSRIAVDPLDAEDEPDAASKKAKR